jgi:hypothetical protein
MHKVQPNQKVVILTVQIAVPADVSPSAVFDEISALLSEQGTEMAESAILDWTYSTPAYNTQAEAEPEEGDIFYEHREGNWKYLEGEQ